MKTRIVTGTMLILLLIGMLTLTFNIQPAIASLPVHNIDTGEGFATIQQGGNPIDSQDFSSDSTEGAYRELWIAPKPYRDGTHWDGSYDFDELFTDEGESQWADARQAVKVFKFYQFWPHYLPDDQLAQMLVKLDSWGIQVALEAGAVKEWGLANEAFDVVKSCIERIQRLGGQVSYLAMDEPLVSGTMPPPDGWGFTIEETAEETAKFVSLVKANFPNITVGDIEPYPCFSKSELVRWINAYKNASGEDFSFFHIDVDRCAIYAHQPEYGLPYKCFQDIRDLSDFVRSRDSEFGMIFIDNLWRAESDEQFYKDTLEWAYEYYASVESNCTDHAVIQSWLDKPDYVLPDSSGFSFTQLVRDFSLKNASSLSISINQDFQLIQGRLTDNVRNPLSGRSVGLSYTAPLGTMQELLIETRAPNASNTAIVGFRVNDETSFSKAPMKFNFYNISLSAPGGRNLVRNFNFSEGFSGWGIWGNGTAELVPRDEGEGQMLHVIADESEFVNLNSEAISVNGEQTYLLSVWMKPFAFTPGSGYFTVVWLNQSKEIIRERIYIGSPAHLTTAITNETGWFSLLWRPKVAGKYVVTARYLGEQKFWGAQASIDIAPIPGDVNGDGIVNIIDGVIIGVAFGSRTGDPNWNPIADIVPDNFINIQDIVLWAIHFGETYP